MSKRMLGCDVLGEVRRALRTLRRVEKWLVQQERDKKRAGAKARAKLLEGQHRRDLEREARLERVAS